MKKLILLLFLLLSINLFSQSQYKSTTYEDQYVFLKVPNFQEYWNHQVGNHYIYDYNFIISLPDSSVWWNVRDSRQGDLQMMFKSTNKGKTWEHIYESKKVVEYMFFVDKNVGYGFIKKEDDYFAYQNSKIKDTFKLKYQCKYDINNQIITSFNTGMVIVKTEDGGKSWKDISIVNKIENINNKENILSEYRKVYNWDKNFPSLDYLLVPIVFDFKSCNNKIFLLGGDDNHDMLHPIGYISNDKGITWNILSFPNDLKLKHLYAENVRFIRGKYYCELDSAYELYHLISDDGINWTSIKDYIRK